MSVSINGTGSITGLSVGGLPDGSVDADSIAAGAVTDAKIGTGINAAKLADGTVTSTELQYISTLSSNAQTQIAGAGELVQVVHAVYTTYATGSTVWPLDNTIPQNTDGDQFYTLAITPTHASNILYIEVYIAAARGSSTTQSGVGLFQDTTTNALAVAAFSSSVGNGACPMSFKHKMAAGTTSSTTFKVRAGDSNSSNFRINGSNTQHYGGVWGSTITITEIKV